MPKFNVGDLARVKSTVSDNGRYADFKGKEGEITGHDWYGNYNLRFTDGSSLTRASGAVLESLEVLSTYSEIDELTKERAELEDRIAEIGNLIEVMEDIGVLSLTKKEKKAVGILDSLGVSVTKEAIERVANEL